MISNKTAAVLFLIITNMKLVASTTPGDPQESSSSGKLVFRKRKQRPAPKSGKNTLKDDTSKSEDVAAIRGSIKASIQQKQPGPKVNKKFEELIKRGEYEEIAKLGETMSEAEFFEQVRLLVKTLDQYNGVVKHPKRCTMIAAFFIYGDIDVVREAIDAEARTYGDKYHFHDRNLRLAVSIAFKIDYHDRIIELLAIRQKMTAEQDKQLGHGYGYLTGFSLFCGAVFSKLDLENDSMPLRRFMTFKREELGSKNPEIYNIFCQVLVRHLYCLPHYRNSKELLVDLVGQPSLLTSKIFAKGFFESGSIRVEEYINFINYDWAEATEEALKEEYPTGGRDLWNFMTLKFPERFSGPFPDTDESREAVGKKFPTKEQLEERWVKKNAPDFLKRLEEFIADIFPTVLVKLIFEYAKPQPTLLDDQRIKTL